MLRELRRAKKRFTGLGIGRQVFRGRVDSMALRDPFEGRLFGLMVKETPIRPERSEPADDESDLALLARIQNGDRTALRELYVKYHPVLLRFIYRITGQFELAQEGVNDVMFVVWNKSHSFQGRSSVSTWILGVAYHKALTLSRDWRRWFDRRAPVTDFEEWIEHSDAAVEPSDSTDVKDLLAQALKRLPRDQRVVVELTYFHGCSYQEIAVVMSCPVNTVKTRMFHARAKLKKLLPHLGRDDLLE